MSACKLLSILVTASAFATLGACAASSDEEPAGWQGDTVTEGAHTTTTTVSGSVWQEPRVLVEKASIGVLEGAEEFMFGDITSIAASTERIVVADRQLPIVRAYDWEGNYLHDVGGVGDGPGEYRGPYGVALLADGRITVRDDRRYLIHVYDADGQVLETWPTQHRVLSFTPTRVTPEDRVFVFTSQVDGEVRTSGFREAGPAGLIGEILQSPSFGVSVEPVTMVVTSDRGQSFRGLPWFPRHHSTFTHDLSHIVGASAEYRFQVARADGTTLTIANEAWQPVPVSEQERGDALAALTDWARSQQPDWTWDLPPIPETRPAFEAFIPARDGAIWVRRSGPAEKRAPCEDEPRALYGCWQATFNFDVFDAAGRLLGSVAHPPGLVSHLEPYIDGDDFIAVVQDDDGTVFVKRYKLERPESTS